MTIMHLDERRFSNERLGLLMDHIFEGLSQQRTPDEDALTDTDLLRVSPDWVGYSETANLVNLIDPRVTRARRGSDVALDVFMGNQFIRAMVENQAITNLARELGLFDIGTVDEREAVAYRAVYPSAAIHPLSHVADQIKHCLAIDENPVVSVPDHIGATFGDGHEIEAPMGRILKARGSMGPSERLVSILGRITA